MFTIRTGDHGPMIAREVPICGRPRSQGQRDCNLRISDLLPAPSVHTQAYSHLNSPSKLSPWGTFQRLLSPSCESLAGSSRPPVLPSIGSCGGRRGTPKSTSRVSFVDVARRHKEGKSLIPLPEVKVQPSPPKNLVDTRVEAILSS
jgi:hypothetical protein